MNNKHSVEALPNKMMQFLFKIILFDFSVFFMNKVQSFWDLSEEICQQWHDDFIVLSGMSQY